MFTPLGDNCKIVRYRRLSNIRRNAHVCAFVAQVTVLLSVSTTPQVTRTECSTLILGDYLSVPLPPYASPPLYLLFLHRSIHSTSDMHTNTSNTRSQGLFLHNNAHDVEEAELKKPSSSRKILSQEQMDVRRTTVCTATESLLSKVRQGVDAQPGEQRRA